MEGYEDEMEGDEDEDKQQDENMEEDENEEDENEQQVSRYNNSLWIGLLTTYIIYSGNFCRRHLLVSLLNHQLTSSPHPHLNHLKKKSCR